MKKSMIISLVILVLMAFPIKSAKAQLVLDPAAQVQKITDNVQIIQEHVQTGQKYVNDAKQMKTQGLNKGALLKKLGKYAITLAIAGFSGYYIRKKIAEGRNKKEKDNLEKTKKSKSDNLSELADVKRANTETNINKTNEVKEVAQGEVNQLQSQIDNLKERVNEKKNERAQLVEKIEGKNISDNELENLNKQIIEKEEEIYKLEQEIIVLEDKKRDKETEIEEIEKKLETLEKDKDKIEKEEKERKDTINRLNNEVIASIDEQEKKAEEYVNSASENMKGLINEKAGVDDENKEDEDSWHATNPEDFLKQFTPEDKDYKAFVKLYFYNPTSLPTSPEQNGKEGEEKQDEVLVNPSDEPKRQRSYAVTAAAAHLLQVTSSVKAEIEARKEKLQETAKQTVEGANEREAISSYALTRIEETRALLMYAKILAAKIKYGAVTGLDKIEVEKEKRNENYDYTTFHLEDYQISDAEVKAILNPKKTVTE